MDEPVPDLMDCYSLSTLEVHENEDEESTDEDRGRVQAIIKVPISGLNLDDIPHGKLIQAKSVVVFVKARNRIIERNTELMVNPPSFLNNPSHFLDCEDDDADVNYEGMILEWEHRKTIIVSLPEEPDEDFPQSLCCQNAFKTDAGGDAGLVITNIAVPAIEFCPADGLVLQGPFIHPIELNFKLRNIFDTALQFEIIAESLPLDISCNPSQGLFEPNEDVEIILSAEPGCVKTLRYLVSGDYHITINYLSVNEGGSESQGTTGETAGQTKRGTTYYQLYFLVNPNKVFRKMIDETKVMKKAVWKARSLKTFLILVTIFLIAAAFYLHNRHKKPKRRWGSKSSTKKRKRKKKHRFF